MLLQPHGSSWPPSNSSYGGSQGYDIIHNNYESDSEALRKTSGAQKALHAEQSKKGCLQSGATVKRAVAIIEEEASAHVEQAIDQVSAEAQVSDAFALIVSHTTGIFRALSLHLHEAIRLAAGGKPNSIESVQTAGEKLFVEARARIFKQLEIHRFSFVKPSKGDLAARVASD